MMYFMLPRTYSNTYEHLTFSTEKNGFDSSPLCSDEKMNLPSRATEKPSYFSTLCSENILFSSGDTSTINVNLPSRATANLSSPSQATEKPSKLSNILPFIKYLKPFMI